MGTPVSVLSVQEWGKALEVKQPACDCSSSLFSIFLVNSEGMPGKREMVFPWPFPN